MERGAEVSMTVVGAGISAAAVEAGKEVFAAVAPAEVLHV